MTRDDLLERGRRSFERRAWGDAYAQLSAADGSAALDVTDLERLAVAAYLLGRDDDSTDLWARAHHRCVRSGDAPGAARCGFWLAFHLLLRGEVARSGGWLARARRVLDTGGDDCVEHGYVQVLDGLRAMGAGDLAVARTAFDAAAEIGDRFGDADLTTLGRLGRGQSLIGSGQTAPGVALLDEAMVAVTADEVSPIVVGIVYCAVIEACHGIFDLRRAQEWTAALTRWCDAQPDLVPYRGQCLVHRAEILQMRGAWPDAMDAAAEACDRLGDRPAAGSARYQQAELHRLRGELDPAEAAYRQASECGRSPHPGLALLWLAQGRVGAAAAAIRREVDEGHDRVARSQMLAAYVEIVLADGDATGARRAADELAGIAADVDAPLLRAVSAQATGTVLLVDDARAALAPLRRAWTAWRELDAPYEAARVRVLVGLACRELGDEGTAAMELDAARSVFADLGAAHDLARVRRLAAPPAAPVSGSLTARELEVLALVATGRTNRSIADDLVISEKTVARHLSNIFTKLGLSSRAAATAYAYEHELV